MLKLGTGSFTVPRVSHEGGPSISLPPTSADDGLGRVSRISPARSQLCPPRSEHPELPFGDVEDSEGAAAGVQRPPGLAMRRPLSRAATNASWVWPRSRDIGAGGLKERSRFGWVEIQVGSR